MMVVGRVVRPGMEVFRFDDYLAAGFLVDGAMEGRDREQSCRQTEVQERTWFHKRWSQISGFIP